MENEKDLITENGNGNIKNENRESEPISSENAVTDNKEATVGDNGIQQKAKQESRSFAACLFDCCEVLLIATVAVFLMFTFSVRLCRVDGPSMTPTLENNEMLFVNGLFYTPKQGDIIIIHPSFKTTPKHSDPLVKRVIATGGQFVKIEYVPFEKGGMAMKVFVSNDDTFEASELLEETYIDYTAVNKQCLFRPTVYRSGVYEVPDNCVFFMGDNRFNSADSRDPNIGCIDQRNILGKVLFRVPTLLGTVK